MFISYKVTIFIIPTIDCHTNRYPNTNDSNIIFIMQEFTYEQIREKAIRQGVKDNKVHIGLWANLNNYLKTRRKNNGKVITYYISLQELAY